MMRPAPLPLVQLSCSDVVPTEGNVILVACVLGAVQAAAVRPTISMSCNLIPCRPPFDCLRKRSLNCVELEAGNVYVPELIYVLDVAIAEAKPPADQVAPLSVE